MEVTRTYTHRKFGNIGVATLIVPDGDWTLGGAKLPASSIEHLATFALQTLQDAYAGADDETEAKANWAKKLDRLMNGTLGTRSGEGLSDTRSVAIYRLYVAAMDAETRKRFNKAFDSQAAKVRKALENAASFTDDAIAGEVAVIEAEREAAAIERERRAKAVAGLAGKIDFNF